VEQALTATDGQLLPVSGGLEVLSGFVRQSALQSSAVVEKKMSVKEPQPAEPERELVVVELEPSGHWVDGEFAQR
jgi:hypothetical protein